MLQPAVRTAISAAREPGCAHGRTAVKMAEDDEAKAPSVGVEPWEQDRPLFYQGDGAEVQRPPPSHHDRFFYKYVRIPAAAPLRGAYVPPSCTVLCPCS